MAKEQYMVSDNNFDFHQFSFSNYDDSINEWKNGVVIQGKNIPAKIEGDQITMVINEPNVMDRPWGQSQTDLLVSFYKPYVKPLAKKYGLKELNISIEPNQYGAVMLALTTNISQRDELQSLIDKVFMSAEEIRDLLGVDYQDFVLAHWRLNADWDNIIEYETAEDYVEMMKEATETAGYTWDDDSAVEHTQDWNEANQQKEEA